MSDESSHLDRSNGERLATLEERRRSQDKFNEYVVGKLKSIDQAGTDTNEKLDTLLLKMAGQKGFVAGIVAAVTTIFSVIGIAVDYLINHSGGAPH